MNSLIIENVKESSKRPVIARCLKYMNALDDIEQIQELSTKTFKELHELAKKLKSDSNYKITPILNTALKTSHVNSVSHE